MTQLHIESMQGGTLEIWLECVDGVRDFALDLPLSQHLITCKKQISLSMTACEGYYPPEQMSCGLA